MTYEETLNNLIHCEIWHGDDWDEETKHTIAGVIMLLEKVRDKYRWHDLRKDPEDLPPIMEQVLLKVQIGNEDYEYITASRITGNDNGWTCFGYPVAWREIEPLEVTE